MIKTITQCLFIYLLLISNSNNVNTSRLHPHIRNFDISLKSFTIDGMELLHNIIFV